MALEKVVQVDKVELVGSFHHAQIRTATIIMDNGEEISRSFHRKVIAPGDDYSQEEQFVQDICSAAHTPEIVAAYEAHLAESQAEVEPEAEASADPEVEVEPEPEVVPEGE